MIRCRKAISANELVASDSDEGDNVPVDVDNLSDYEEVDDNNKIEC